MQVMVKVMVAAAALLFWIPAIQPLPSVVGADFVMKTSLPRLAPPLFQPPATITFPVGQKPIASATLPGLRVSTKKVVTW